MILQTQPNRASCLATAFAMCMDIPVQEIFDDLGHEGTEIAFTNLEVPRCFRGFHSMELMECAFRRGYAVLELTKEMHISHDDSTIKSYKSRFDILKYLANHCVVMTNSSHAVAWNKYSVYDPVGLVYPDRTILGVYHNHDIFYVFGKMEYMGYSQDQLFDLHINGMHDH